MEDRVRSLCTAVAGRAGGRPLGAGTIRPRSGWWAGLVPTVLCKAACACLHASGSACSVTGLGPTGPKQPSKYAGPGCGGRRCPWAMGRGQRGRGCAVVAPWQRPSVYSLLPSLPHLLQGVLVCPLGPVLWARTEGPSPLPTFPPGLGPAFPVPWGSWS